MSAPTHRVFSLLLTAAALAIPAYVIAGTFWPRTEQARELTTLAPDSSPVGSELGCTTPTTFVDRDSVWSRCGYDPLGFVRMSPEEGIAQALWPEAGTLAESSYDVRGLLPGANGFLGIVLVDDDVSTPSSTWVGVLGPDGWRVEPKPVPVEFSLTEDESFVNASLMGMVWRGETLEFARTVSTESSERDLAYRWRTFVHALSPDGELSAREITDVTGGVSGRVVAAHAPAPDRRWRLLVDRPRFSDDSALRDARSSVVEFGAGEAPEIVLDELDVSCLNSLAYCADTLTIGLLPRVTVFGKGRYLFFVDQNGNWREGEFDWPVAIPENSDMVSHLELVDGVLGFGYTFAPREGPPPEEPSAPRSLSSTRLLETPDGVLELVERDGERSQERILLGRAYETRTFHEIAIGARLTERLLDARLLPRKGGGFWLVNTHGHYVAVDATGHRLDPPGALERAEMLAGRYGGRFWMTFWGHVLGPFACILFALGRSRLVRRDGAEDADARAARSFTRVLFASLLFFALGLQAVRSAYFLSMLF